MTLRVGTVTIGQAPRTDVTPDLMKILGAEVELIEAGALDGLSSEQIAAMAPRPGDYVLVTRMADGTSVKICERAVTPLLRQKIAAHFAAGIPAVNLGPGDALLAHTDDEHCPVSQIRDVAGVLRDWLA